MMFEGLNTDWSETGTALLEPGVPAGAPLPATPFPWSDHSVVAYDDDLDEDESYFLETDDEEDEDFIDEDADDFEDEDEESLDTETDDDDDDDL